MALNITNTNLAFPGQFVDIQLTPTTSTATAGLTAAPRWVFSDLTSTAPTPSNNASQGDFAAPRRAFRALVYLKAFTPTTASSTGTIARVGPLVTLEAATSTGYNPVYRLDAEALGGSGSGRMVLYLTGMMPLSDGAQFARVNFVSVGDVGQAASTALDVIIEAV